MSLINTSADRHPHDLSHLIFDAGKIGRLQTISTVPVIAGDSYEENLVGSLRLSALRRGLAADSTVDILSFYVPHRHIFGEAWEEFLRNGVNSTPLPMGDVAWSSSHCAHLGISGGSFDENPLNYFSPSKVLLDGYDQIWNEYFKVPYEVDQFYPPSVQPDSDYGKYGRACANLKSIWTTPLPPESGNSADYVLAADGTSATLNIQTLSRAAANLQTTQERDFFMDRYRDIMDNFGGSASTDADQRPTLMKRTTFWASGYDVNGTDQQTLGQYSGRVQQSFKHQVPRFFCPEHGMIWTMALVRFPVTHQKENHLMSSDLNFPWTYENIAGDTAVNQNRGPQTVNSNQLFGAVAGVGYEFEVPDTQWYRTQPDKVHGDYADAQGFPFLTHIPSDKYDALYVDSTDFDQMFQTDQLGHYQIQARKNVNIMRRLPDARSTIMANG